MFLRKSHINIKAASYDSFLYPKFYNVISHICNLPLTSDERCSKCIIVRDNLTNEVSKEVWHVRLFIALKIKL
jgi:hypothetical protein